MNGLNGRVNQAVLFDGSNDDWHRWACTYNATMGERKIYQDGVLKKAYSHGANLYQGSRPVYIGANWANSNEYFAGTIDEVRAYNRVLSLRWSPTTWHI
jgi:hypothetical protein